MNKDIEGTVKKVLKDLVSDVHDSKLKFYKTEGEMIKESLSDVLALIPATLGREEMINIISKSKLTGLALKYYMSKWVDVKTFDGIIDELAGALEGKVFVGVRDADIKEYLWSRMDDIIACVEDCEKHRCSSGLGHLLSLIAEHLTSKLPAKEEEDIMGGETPKLPSNPTQEEMLQIAMRDIRNRKEGKYKLVYDKDTRTIVAKELPAKVEEKEKK